MGQAREDLAALLRCWRYSLGLPAAVTSGWRALGPLAHAYEAVVAPLVAREISNTARLPRVNRALCAMSVKIGATMLAYAALAGRPLDIPVAALAGAVTRLYDDLIDRGADGDESIAERLGDVLAGRPHAAASDLERLLGALVADIRRRRGLGDGDIAVTALLALHEYQCLSRRQRDPGVPRGTLDKICRGKGAMAHLTLCRLVHPGMDVVERELVMALGEVLQSVDDYMDADLDRRAGVATLVSTGATTLADIVGGFRALRAPLSARYGTAATRTYYGMLYFLILKSAAGRRLPILGRVAGRLAGRSGALAFLTRGSEVIP
jgi:hypothetical protein